jgi:hypothetical protein
VLGGDDVLMERRGYLNGLIDQSLKVLALPFDRMDPAETRSVDRASFPYMNGGNERKR